MDKKDLKEKICKVIDENAELIMNVEKEIYDNPELGYKENYATKLVMENFEKLGLKIDENITVTGCIGTTNEKIGPTIGVMGELDAVICREHPDSNKDTGAVHACGHNIQIAGMLGSAIGLILSDALDYLDGNIKFIAVPAEEYVELAFRTGLKEKGEINYLGGKQEFIYKDLLDDIDISMMFHALDMSKDNKKVLIGPTGNGFIGKNVQFIGEESHAGGAPEEGVNALNAAMLAINNINAQRETFKDEDMIRVHPIITKGGDIVNVVPADVRMETYVRGKSIKGILDANKKVNRALIAGAKAVGAEVKITEIPGYLPLLNNEELDKMFKSNIENFISKDQISTNGSFAGSFDFGDISHIIPSLHPFIGGVKGNLHTRDFKVHDPYLAYIVPAKSMAMTIVDLLFNNAIKAKEVIENFTPKMTKEEYLDFLSDVSKEILEK